MKKLLLVVLGLSLFSAQAQTLRRTIESQKQDPTRRTLAEGRQLKKQSLKRSPNSFWFSPLELASVKSPSTGVSNFQGTAQLMYPDSNVIVVPGGVDPNFHWWFHGVGTSCDPLDNDWDITSTNTHFSRYNTYSWDSLSFPYYYLRKVDSVKVNNVMVPVVDTLYVHYFLPARMSFNSFTITGVWPVGQRFAFPTSMNYKRAMPLNATKIDTIFLTKAFKTKDSGGLIFAGGITLPVNINNAVTGTIESRSTVGATITYQPMIKSPYGDTIAVGTGIAEPFKQVNQFRCRMENNTGGQVSDEGSYNASMLNTSQVRYGQVLSGFIKNYIPGSLYTQKRYWDANFHFTTNNLAVRNTSNEVSVLNVYPNPATENSEVVLTLNSDKNADAMITLTDISGKVIKTINAQLLDGKNTITISTDSLTKGLYLVNLVGEGFTSSSKLVIE